MDTDTQRKADRVKALLAGYYGAGGSIDPNAPPTGTTDSAGKGRPAAAGGGAMALDSPAFDANQHLVQMLKVSSLERLMVEHRNTAREIKNLDTDMQQLVTENYNKFITATDTIRVMKTEVDQAVPELLKLTSIMNGVTDRSTTISSKLQARQDKMEELYRVQALLKKLQAVFDLPKRMRAALEEDVLDTAVSFYAEAQPLLKKYSNKGTFKQIAADSDAVAREISQVLKRRLAERKDDTEQCVLLLRKLGEPDDSLQGRYLDGRAHRMRKILKDAGTVLQAMAAAAAAAGSPPGSPARAAAGAAAAAAKSQLEAAATWGFDAEGNAPGLKAFIKALDEKVINAVQETVMNVMRFFMSKDSSPEEMAAKRKPVVALAEEVFNEFFVIARQALSDFITASVSEAACLNPGQGGRPEELDINSPSVAFSSNWGTEVLAQAVNTLSADLSIVSGGLPELGLKDKAQQLVAGACQHHMALCFLAMTSRITGAVRAVQSHASGQGSSNQGQGLRGQGGDGSLQGGAGSSGQVLRKGYAFLVDLAARGLEALMQGLKSYEAHSRLLSNNFPDFMHNLQACVQSWFLDLLSSLLSFCGVRYDGSDATREALKAQLQPSPLSQAANSSQWPTSPQLHPVQGTAPASIAAASGRLGGGGGVGGGDAGRTGIILVLAKLCTYMEQNSVPWVMEQLASFFVGRPLPPGAAPSHSDAPPAFIPGEVARRLSASSSALLSTYVEAHGRQLSLMVRRSVAATSWLHHKEPRGPRPVCDLLVERLSRAESEVVQLVEDTGRRTDAAAAAVVGGAARNDRGFGAGLMLETGNVERNLAKIFREKVKVFGGPVQLTQAAILGAICGVGLKSLVECIRLQTLGRAGLQQLQLDCHYLRGLLRRFTGGRAQQVVDSLLDEVVSGGVERSLEPSLLEPAVLDKIMASMDSN